MWVLDYKESWAPKNWCFWTVVLEKILESPFDCKETKPINSKGNQPWNSLEVLMLKLKLQYFGHLMWRTDSLEKTLILRKIKGRRRRGWQRMRWLDGITDSKDMRLSNFWSLWCTGRPAVQHSMDHKESDTTEWLKWIAHGLPDGSAVKNPPVMQ